MFDQLRESSYPDFIKRYITDLDTRIRALRNRMAAMVLEKYEIRNQEILLAVMLETRKDLENLHAELATTSNKSSDVF